MQILCVIFDLGTQNAKVTYFIVSPIWSRQNVSKSGYRVAGTGAHTWRPSFWGWRAPSMREREPHFVEAVSENRNGARNKRVIFFFFFFFFYAHIYVYISLIFDTKKYKKKKKRTRLIYNNDRLLLYIKKTTRERAVFKNYSSDGIFNT